MKKLVWTVALLSIIVALPLVAKDKEYQDGTLLQMERWHPDRFVAFNAAVNGYKIKPAWVFVVQVGDWTFGSVVEKNFGSLNEAEWPANTPVKIRFDIKGGAVATRTTMHIQRPDGKELSSQVMTIKDKAGAEYCGTRKCDPESAAKKLAKESSKN